MEKQTLKEKLERNIWITRKCRINASERLLSTARYIEVLNVVYSIFCIILSILSYLYHDDILSLFCIGLSIALTISIIYANATGFRNRSLALKQNYIELQLLLDQLFYIKDDDKNEINRISSKYAELLKSSENHISFDMYRMKIQNKDIPISLRERIFYILIIVFNYSLRLILFSIPFAIIILYYVRIK